MIDHKRINYNQKGFTIVEVALAVAIGGLLFTGVLGSTMANINRQRYNDSAQSFTDFLRQIYGEVISVENPRSSLDTTNVLCTANSNNVIETSGVAGRSNCLIYGKLITIGEGNASDEYKNNIARVYDVIGDNRGDENVPLTDLNLDTVTRKVDGTCKYALAGNEYQYRLEWNALVKDTSGNNFKGSILIIRDPNAGVVDTYFYNKTLEIQSTIGKATSISNGNCAKPSKKIPDTNNYYAQLISTGDPNTSKLKSNFKHQDINFCLASDDLFAYNGKQRMITIASNGNNSSAVKLWNQGEGDCK